MDIEEILQKNNHEQKSKKILFWYHKKFMNFYDFHRKSRGGFCILDSKSS